MGLSTNEEVINKIDQVAPPRVVSYSAALGGWVRDYVSQVAPEPRPSLFTEFAHTQLHSARARAITDRVNGLSLAEPRLLNPRYRYICAREKASLVPRPLHSIKRGGVGSGNETRRRRGSARLGRPLVPADAAFIPRRECMGS